MVLKPVPLIVITVPGGPVFGVKFVIVKAMGVKVPELVALGLDVEEEEEVFTVSRAADWPFQASGTRNFSCVPAPFTAWARTEPAEPK